MKLALPKPFQCEISSLGRISAIWILKMNDHDFTLKIREENFNFLNYRSYHLMQPEFSDKFSHSSISEGFL